MLVRIAPPSLSHHSSPAARDFQFSISVEAHFHRCHLDVQSLLHQQLLSSAMLQYMVVSSQWIRQWYSHACSATADFSIIPLLQASRCSFSLICSLRLVSLMQTWPQLQGIQYTTLDCLPGGNVSFTLINIKRRVCLDLKTTLMLNFLQTCLISQLTHPSHCVEWRSTNTSWYISVHQT